MKREIASSSKHRHSTEIPREEEFDSEEERRVGEQGRFLLNMFMNERAQNTLHESVIGELCQGNAADAQRLHFNDENLNDIAITLRRIMDDISIFKKDYG